LISFATNWTDAARLVSQPLRLSITLLLFSFNKDKKWDSQGSSGTTACSDVNAGDSLVVGAARPNHAGIPESL
jgi:hypothetical protein